jgi:catechol 2,3-dioxygenase-like lactoylglutathione lyase family enzyme
MTMPGLQGLAHIGLTVPNLDQAVAFFTRVLGFESQFRLGPFIAADDWMTVHLNVEARAEIRQIAVMTSSRLSMKLELFEYGDNIEKRDVGPRNSDVGGHHIAFAVDDMKEAVRWLKANDLRVLGEPTQVAEGATAGTSWVYFFAPWGLQLALVSYPPRTKKRTLSLKKAVEPL